MITILPNRLFITSVASEVKRNPEYNIFTTPEDIDYVPFCDDFGPFDITSVIFFSCTLTDEMDAHRSKRIVYLVDTDPRRLTNSVFLLGAFLMLTRKMEPGQVWAKFSSIEETLLEPYRDASFDPPDFALSLLDCWRGLWRAMSLHWLALPTTRPTVWGQIDLEEYEHYEDPLNGDITQVVPGKLIAFKGPVDLGSSMYSDRQGFRRFSPSYYVQVFQHLGVKTVVRLNEECYHRSAFENHRIRHVDLPFDDSGTPPMGVVSEFMRVARESSGLVAVHCKTGLGRTGTLVAAYMMRYHGFTAREAMGWLRIMRPGSVMGEQDSALAKCISSLPPISFSQSISLAILTQLHIPMARARAMGALLPKV
eukprot:CAMPEP_0113682970 /NCGR_PEP_ID=MMETSP0038_2-20120614/13003_1 /TAXON_ID=2898 /ORGANISM="Cryptomonas paramecium" /LENGTH=365 /DNA_ID=CAMNT_0000602187 /DNA_START=87 /DNA_END=1185 /DNA_ORIENTATION=+ /assembly_acc=CAM_ASM_000170